MLLLDFFVRGSSGIHIRITYSHKKSILITRLLMPVHVGVSFAGYRWFSLAHVSDQCAVWQTYSDLHSFSFWAQVDVCDTPLSTSDTAGPSSRHHGSLQRQCTSRENKKCYIYHQAVLKPAQVINVTNLRLFHLNSTRKLSVHWIRDWMASK